MSDHTSKRLKTLWDKFADKKYRDAFVASHLSSNISSQIFSVREDRKWTQKELADAAGMAQTRISLMEGPSYEQFSLSTLKRIASAFDVALVVRFVRFSDIAKWAANVQPEDLAVLAFEDDAKVIASGLLPDGQDPTRDLTPAGRAEVRAAIERLLDVAGVGLTDMQRLAIQCGNEPYADYKVCPTCKGCGHVPAL